MGTLQADRAIIFPLPPGDRPFGSPGIPLDRGFFCVARAVPSRQVGRGCQSFRQAAGFGARHHKEAGSAMEPAKTREIAMMAAKLPSQALPQSLEAAKRSIITV